MSQQYEAHRLSTKSLRFLKFLFLNNCIFVTRFDLIKYGWAGDMNANQNHSGVRIRSNDFLF